MFTGWAGLNHPLGTIVIESVIRIYDGLAEPLSCNASKRRHFKYC